jgi:hypothetical protein
MLPSEREAADQKAKQLADARAMDRLAMMREDFSRTFSTEHGRRVLAWIRQRSQHNQVILSATAQKGIDPMLTTFAAMELNFYLEIRKHVPKTILKEIEYDDIDPSGTVREPASGNTTERTGRKRGSAKRGS